MSKKLLKQSGAIITLKDKEKIKDFEEAKRRQGVRKSSIVAYKGEVFFELQKYNDYDFYYYEKNVYAIKNKQIYCFDKEVLDLLPKNLNFNKYFDKVVAINKNANYPFYDLENIDGESVAKAINSFIFNVFKEKLTINEIENYPIWDYS